jgi:hypothetical protein
VNDHPVQSRRHSDLAGKATRFGPSFHENQHCLFEFGPLRQQRGPARVDDHVACRAGAIAATSCFDSINAIENCPLHHREADGNLNGVATFAGPDVSNFGNQVDSGAILASRY